MTSYNNFIGIDIGKFTFVVATFGRNDIHEFNNDDKGIRAFMKKYQPFLMNSLSVLETTGGYEMRLLLKLCEKGYSVHRANTRKVKNFIRSYGNTAKTDALDAKALALYGSERATHLACYTPQSEQVSVLFELVQRRKDLKHMLSAEKNRLQAPKMNAVKSSCQTMITVLSEQIDSITQQINELIEQDAALKAKKDVLKTIPGIGDIIANELLVLLPELGHLSRREIASLAGVAPRANDSGRYRGYRSTGHGRERIKPMLFLAAMAARNSNSPLKAFYDRLIASGKKKMVALTALMRKIIVIANARMKEVHSH